MQLTLKEVYLDYFTFVQARMNDLMGGSALKILPDGLANPNGQQVLKFSKSFLEQIQQQHAKGYQLASAKVNFMVWWKKAEEEKAVLVVLPELVFEKWNQ